MNGEVFVVGGMRTLIGKFGGSLRPLTAIDLGVHAVRETLEALGIESEAVDLAVVGLARQAGTGPNPGRLISAGAGVPNTAPAYTVQQACLSGMLAVIDGARAIRLGEAGVVLAVGVEHMTNIPHLVFGARWGNRMGDMTLLDGLFRDGFIDPLTGKHMGELCDLLADRYEIGREAQDAFALESQRRWASARTSAVDEEIIAPVSCNGKALLTQDEHPRPNSTMEDLAKLPPAFRKAGTVTAGNSCGLADGAAAIVLASESAVRRLNLTPVARVLGWATAAIDPADYAIAPVAATKQLLANLRMSIDRFDFVEINEAFAAQMLACIRNLKLDREKVNVWGGAIAGGHPIGMSGTRLLVNLAHQLKRLGGRYGLATICGNGGQGASIAIERV